jgi:hypothetical protein
MTQFRPMQNELELESAIPTPIFENYFQPRVVKRDLSTVCCNRGYNNRNKSVPRFRLLKRSSVFASYLIWLPHWPCRRTQWSRCQTRQNCCWRPSLHGLHRLCFGHVKFGVGLRQGSNNSSSSTCWGQVNNSNSIWVAQDNGDSQNGDG